MCVAFSENNIQTDQLSVSKLQTYSTEALTSALQITNWCRVCELLVQSIFQMVQLEYHSINQLNFRKKRKGRARGQGCLGQTITTH